MKITDGQVCAINALLKNKGVPMCFNEIDNACDPSSGFWFNTMHSLKKKGLVESKKIGKVDYWKLTVDFGEKIYE